MPRVIKGLDTTTAYPATHNDSNIVRRKLDIQTHPRERRDEASENLTEEDIKFLNSFAGIRFINPKQIERMNDIIRKLESLLLKNRELPNGLDRNNLFRILSNVVPNKHVRDHLL